MRCWRTKVEYRIRFYRHGRSWQPADAVMERTLLEAGHQGGTWSGSLSAPPGRDPLEIAIAVLNKVDQER